ncbi:MAG: hypothetical protein WCD37_11135 [Chloroflexia bacterium]
MQQTSQRPMGITILAVLAAIGGLFGLFAALSLLGGPYGIYGIISLITSLAYLAFAYGAWTLQPWAWMLGLGIAGLVILLQILYLFLIPGYSIVNVIIGAIIPAIIIYYLMTPDVKRAFGQPA